MLDKLKELIFKGDKSTSPVGKVDKADVKKIVINALMTGGAAAIAVLVNYVGGLDLGVYTAIAIPPIKAGLEYVYRLLKDNTPVVETEEVKE